MRDMDGFARLQLVMFCRLVPLLTIAFIALAVLWGR
jgi:hypothetical protein